MVYALQGKPEEYRLPDPVPLDTVTGNQVWSWLGGLVPGAFVLAWLWKKAVSEADAQQQAETKAGTKAEEEAWLSAEGVNMKADAEPPVEREEAGNKAEENLHE
jgi:hypothetical protein